MSVRASATLVGSCVRSVTGAPVSPSMTCTGAA